MWPCVCMCVCVCVYSFAVIFWVMGVPLSLWLWYMRLYNAAQNDSTVGFIAFLLFFFCHWAFCVFCAIGRCRRCTGTASRGHGAQMQVRACV